MAGCGGQARGKQNSRTNTLVTGLDDKAIESKISALVKEGAQ